MILGMSTSTVNSAAAPRRPHPRVWPAATLLLSMAADLVLLRRQELLARVPGPGVKD
jgi:hypothetical protein